MGPVNVALSMTARRVEMAANNLMANYACVRFRTRGRSGHYIWSRRVFLLRYIVQYRLQSVT